MSDWYRKNVAKDWIDLRKEALEVLQRESELQEIVQLVGFDALPEAEKGVLDTARSIREDYLQQSAYDEVDTYTSIKKQYLMLSTILEFGRREMQAIKQGAQASQINALEAKNKISKIKWTREEQVEELVVQIKRDMEEQLGKLLQEVAV